ncbi:MAG: Na+/H+ antiporter subunit E [Chloroflexota bacterium]
MPGKASNRSRHDTLVAAALEFVSLFAFWLVLSGKYQAGFVALGALCAGAVTILTHDLVSVVFEYARIDKAGPQLTLLRVCRFLGYLPWLFSRIVLGSIQVAGIVLNPRMPVAPALLQFRTRLQTPFARVMVANSITLTPGTITVILEEGRYVVHALIPSAAGHIVEAKMQNKVGAIFLEETEPAPAALWVHSIKELEA